MQAAGRPAIAAGCRPANNKCRQPAGKQQMPAASRQTISAGCQQPANPVPAGKKVFDIH